MKFIKTTLATLIAAPLFVSSFAASAASPSEVHGPKGGEHKAPRAEFCGPDMITKFDVNQDGRLDLPEYKKMINDIHAEMETKRIAHMTRLFTDIDTNHDGVISIDEFINHKPERPEHRQDRHKHKKGPDAREGVKDRSGEHKGDFKKKGPESLEDRHFDRDGKPGKAPKPCGKEFKPGDKGDTSPHPQGQFEQKGSQQGPGGHQPHPPKDGAQQGRSDSSHQFDREKDPRQGPKGPAPKEGEKPSVEDIFSKLDKNHDGFLDNQELSKSKPPRFL